MKLIIDLPDEVKTLFDNADISDLRDFYDFNSTIGKAIKNGAILPKEYGRLIDANVIKDFKDKIKHYKKDYAFSQEEILNIMERYEIKYAPTIIEADKGSEVDE